MESSFTRFFILTASFVIVFVPSDVLSWPKTVVFCAGVAAFLVMELAPSSRKSDATEGLEELRTELADFKTKLTKLNLKVGLQSND